MNKFQKRRLSGIALLLISVSLAVGLILYALKQNIHVFFTPSDLSPKQLHAGYVIRLGGLVKVGSIKRDPHTDHIRFILTDLKKEVSVDYQGLLPDLFREAKGVIALGHFNAAKIFIAREILAKHDEHYLPQQTAMVLSEQSP